MNLRLRAVCLAIAGAFAFVAAPSRADVALTIGDLEAGKSVVIVYEVTIARPLSPAVTAISAQGTIGSDSADVDTDDPETAAAGDATVTQLEHLIPVVDLNGALAGADVTVSFTEQTAAAIAPDGTVADPGGNNILAITAVLASRPNGDGVESLALDSSAQTAASSAALSASYAAATGTLTISGAAADSIYETILRGIVYNNSSDAPVTSDRTVTIVANDTNDSVTRAATVTVSAVNDNPLAVGNTIYRLAGDDTKVKISTLLGNDTDPDGDAVSFVSVPSASAGGATLNRAGDWIYYTRAGTSADSFTYSVSDGLGGTASGTVTVLIQGDSGQSSSEITITLDVSGAHLTFNGIPGITYTVQFTETVEDPESWVDLGTAAASGLGLYRFDDNAGTPARYYRYVYR